ncbi:hypothetical protein GCM10009827_115240 [Dactylosporangium maewongense]|uniref:Uncharacterized protein n=1 Tax=Dactylosporangium maewongense TaxID=634393 RepID=A0ABN2DEN9_9ACTN
MTPSPPHHANGDPRRPAMTEPARSRKGRTAVILGGAAAVIGLLAAVAAVVALILAYNYR